MQMSSMGGQITFPAFSMYHVTKWGIEGFYDALAAEVEPFNIHTTLIEPGMVRTSFFDAATRVPVSAPYRGGPADRAPIPLEDMTDSQEKTVAALIRAGESGNPPHRLVLSSDAWQLMTDALRERLADIEAQRDNAATADAEDKRPGPRVSVQDQSRDDIVRPNPHRRTRHRDRGRRRAGLLLRRRLGLSRPRRRPRLPRVQELLRLAAGRILRLPGEQGAGDRRGRSRRRATTMTGIFEHEFTQSPVGPLPPNGEKVTFRIMNIFRYDDEGKLAEEWVQTDNRGLLRQLGADSGVKG
jgi:short chain dehydrogenase/SnoaL-like polyketide cyclase